MFALWRITAAVALDYRDLTSNSQGGSDDLNGLSIYACGVTQTLPPRLSIFDLRGALGLNCLKAFC